MASSSTARLRRTFQYPNDDSDNDSQPGAMDEQEQELYIQHLSEQNTTRNAQFTSYLQILPLLSSVPYFLSLFKPSTTLLSILALTSLASTIYLLRELPPTTTGITQIDKWTEGGDRPALTRSQLVTHLPYLNAVLGVMLALLEVVASLKAGKGGLLFVGMGYLPGIVYGASILAKGMMASVDPAKELSGLKYGYKGA